MRIVERRRGGTVVAKERSEHKRRSAGGDRTPTGAGEESPRLEDAPDARPEVGADIVRIGALGARDAIVNRIDALDEVDVDLLIHHLQRVGRERRPGSRGDRGNDFAAVVHVDEAR